MEMKIIIRFSRRDAITFIFDYLEIGIKKLLILPAFMKQRAIIINKISPGSTAIVEWMKENIE